MTQQVHVTKLSWKVVLLCVALSCLAVGSWLAGAAQADDRLPFSPLADNRPDMPDWDNAGLYGASVYTIVYNPPRNEIYLGSGGVYKSSDGGLTWEKMFWGAGNASAIAIAPLDGTAYFAKREVLHITSDGGASWAIVEGLQGYIQNITLDPSDSNALFLGTGSESTLVEKGGRIHRSLDGGQNWTTVDVDPGYCISSVAVDPQDNTHIWAVSGACGDFPDHSAVFLSTDRGLSYTPVLTSSFGYEFVQADFEGNHILYLTGKGVRASLDGGAVSAARF
jgi:hypothetical protein